MKFLILAVALLLAPTPTAAQTPCPSCGRIHTQPIHSTPGTFDVVDLLNRQRAKMGLYPLQRDPTLQSVAERRAVLTAAPGRFRGHPRGSFAPGNFEGVGFTSRRPPNVTAVNACGTYTTSKKYVGAAMVVGRNGCYFAVVYR